MFCHISVAFIFKSVGNSDFSTHCLPGSFKCIGDTGKPIYDFTGKVLTVNPVVNFVHESFVSYRCWGYLIFGKSYKIVVIIVEISKIIVVAVSYRRPLLLI